MKFSAFQVLSSIYLYRDFSSWFHIFLGKQDTKFSKQTINKKNCIQMRTEGESYLLTLRQPESLMMCFPKKQRHFKNTLTLKFEACILSPFQILNITYSLFV